MVLLRGHRLSDRTNESVVIMHHDVAESSLHTWPEHAQHDQVHDMRCTQVLPSRLVSSKATLSTQTQWVGCECEHCMYGMTALREHMNGCAVFTLTSNETTCLIGLFVS